MLENFETAFFALKSKKMAVNDSRLQTVDILEGWENDWSVRQILIIASEALKGLILSKEKQQHYSLFIEIFKNNELPSRRNANNACWLESKCKIIVTERFGVCSLLS